MSGSLPCFSRESLRMTCLDYIAHNLTTTIAKLIKSRDLLELYSQTVMPSVLAEDILSVYTSNGYMLTDKIIHMFKRVTQSQLTMVDLSNSMVTDWGLQWLSHHPITHIDLSCCHELQSQAVVHLSKLSSKLKVLVLGNKAHLFLKDNASLHRDVYIDEETGDVCTMADSSLKTPELMVLSINGLDGDSALVILDSFLRQPLNYLQHLDISECKIPIAKLDSLRHMPQLLSLTLFAVLPFAFDLNSCLFVFKYLPNLRHLDISLPFERHTGVQYPSVVSQDEALHKLVSYLQNLVSLDISGTHLGGLVASTDTMAPHTVSRQVPCEPPINHPIPGLAGRHFEFLGLLNCNNNVCERENLPADRVTGHFGADQVIESLRVYQRRSSYCKESLTSLYHILKDDYDSVKDRVDCLNVICHVMKRHILNLDRQISGSAVLFYLIRSYKLRKFASARMIRLAVKTLYDAMEQHFNDQSMLRNGLLTMCHFMIPEDFLFVYKDVVSLLLQIIRQCDLRVDEFLQKISIYILNSLVCKVNNHEKLLVGDEGAVRTMLWLIKSKIEAARSDENFSARDEVLEMAWSTLWNITDETSENCERFLNGEGEEEGLNLFLDCYNIFCDGEDQQSVPDCQDLLRNMMGLLGNVAEVKELRKRFLGPKYLFLFRKLLESKCDGIEVSYNAAGIICHILSDGLDLSNYVANNQESITYSGMEVMPPMDMSDSDESYDGKIPCAVMESSTLSDFDIDDNVGSSYSHVEGATPSTVSNRESYSGVSLTPSQMHEDIKSALVSAINTWDIKSSRGINYRSFKPILRLLTCEHTVEVRHWAVWALCNLTTVYPEKYCALLQEEGGVPLLHDLTVNKSGSETSDVVELAKATLKNFQPQTVQDNSRS